MNNYVKFCDDLDIVFNLPVLLKISRIIKKNPLLDQQNLTIPSPILKKMNRISTHS